MNSAASCSSVHVTQGCSNHLCQTGRSGSGSGSVCVCVGVGKAGPSAALVQKYMDMGFAEEIVLKAMKDNGT